MDQVSPHIFKEKDGTAKKDLQQLFAFIASDERENDLHLKYETDLCITKRQQYGMRSLHGRWWGFWAVSIVSIICSPAQLFKCFMTELDS